MIKHCGAIVLIAVLGLAGSAHADQVKGVNIVYPINGETYPITDPAPGPLSSAYFSVSFSVSCGGGQHEVKWFFDTSGAVGEASFYDQTSIQFVHKLPGGIHVFGVKSDCGSNRVKFKIGN